MVRVRPCGTSLRFAERAGSSLALVALAALSLLPPGDLTICLGGDGHVALSVGNRVPVGPSDVPVSVHCPCDGRVEPLEVAPLAGELAAHDDASHSPCDDVPFEGSGVMGSLRDLESCGPGAARVSRMILESATLVARTDIPSHTCDPSRDMCESNRVSDHHRSVAPAQSARLRV